MKLLERAIDKVFEKSLETSVLFRKYTTSLETITKQVLTVTNAVLELAEVQHLHHQALIDLYSRYSAIGKALQRESVDVRFSPEKAKTTDKPN
jgi:dimeric dUTPase (all-alpha-NTP-PPase superfamily)